MLILTAISLAAIIGVCGVAVDIGRMYIAKNEAQTYCDSAALTAAKFLDGSSAGVTRATASLATNANTWYMATKLFTGSTIYFASSSSGPWETVPSTPSTARYVKVTASVDVPVNFVGVAGATTTSVGISRVVASALAAQVLQTKFSNGLFPFSPYALDTTAAPDYGFVVGKIYTLRWPSVIKTDSSGACTNCCADENATSVAAAIAAASSQRGFYGDSASSRERASIVDDYIIAPVTIGQPLTMTGGSDNTQGDAIVDRINQDTDTTSATYAAYKANTTAGGDLVGNGRRVVGAPINAGPTYSPAFDVLQIGGFFLQTATNYSHAGGSSPLCGEYIGPFTQGSFDGSASSGGGGYVIRLIQ